MKIDILFVMLAALITACSSTTFPRQKGSLVSEPTKKSTSTVDRVVPTLIPSASPSPVILPTATSTNTPVPSAAPTAVPSLNEFKVVLQKDQDLYSAVVRYLKAMSMQGDRITPDEIIDKLIIAELKDVQGNPIYVAEIEGTPLFFCSDGQWIEATWKTLAPLAGLKIGHSKATAYTRSWQKDSQVVRPVLADGNVFFIGHDLFWWNIDGPEDSLRPSIDEFNYKFIGYGVEFAKSENMVLGASSLLHAFNDRLPEWLVTAAEKSSNPRETVIEIVKNHITRVVGENPEFSVLSVVAEIDHPKRKVFWAEVMDQPMAPAQEQFLIEELKLEKNVDYPWMDHLAWMKPVYEWAHAANPDARLLYNDFDLEYGGWKSDQVFQMVRALKISGTPIDGVAFQGHVFGKHLADPTDREVRLNTLAEEIQRYHAAGFEVILAEFDLNMAGVSDNEQERLRIQAEIQHDLMRSFIFNGVKVIIHFSGIDRLSWMEEPERGGPTAAPTSFSDTGDRKPNYYAETRVILEYLKSIQ